MNTLQRPLFRAKGGGAFPDLSGDGKVTQKDILMGRGVIQRQEGGPAGPMMPPQAMAQVPQAMAQGPDPMMVREVEQVQQQNEMAGQQAGADFVAESLRGIDEAEDFEEFINSIRGNAKPIDARRDELASYVGRADADQTPESVLALVQPTFMLTEEGAIDSGIGELLQNITGGVEMMGDSGMPTEMGEGIGGLMMAGQPEQAPIGMQTGGDPAAFFQALQDQYPVGDLGDLVQSNKDLFEQFMTDPNQMSEDDFQKGLALARAGFQLASGVGPGGENIADRPSLSQAASVAGGYIETEAERMAQRRARERQIEMLALQSAMTQRQGQQAFQRELAADIAGKQYDLMGRLAVEEAKKKDPFEVRVLKQPDGPDRIGVVTRGEKGEPVIDFLDLPGQAQDKVDFGDLKPGDIVSVWSEWGPKFSDLTADQQRDLFNGVQTYYKPSFDPEKGLDTPEGLMPAGMARALKGADPDLMNDAMKALIDRSLGTLTTDPGAEPSAVRAPAGEPETETVEEGAIIPAGFDMGEIYGTGSLITKVVRGGMELGSELAEEFTPAESILRPNREPTKVRTVVQSLIQKGKELRRQDIDGRLFASTLDELNQTFDKIDPANNPSEETAQAGYEALSKEYRRSLQNAKDTMAAIQDAQGRGVPLATLGYTTEDLRLARKMAKELPRLVEQFTRAATSFGRFQPQTGGVIMKGDSSLRTPEQVQGTSVQLQSLPGVTRVGG
jgi:hypothetical protein